MQKDASAEGGHEFEEEMRPMPECGCMAHRGERPYDDAVCGMLECDQHNSCANAKVTSAGCFTQNTGRAREAADGLHQQERSG